MFGLKYLRNVSTLEYDEGKCIGCRMCIIVCPHGVFKMNGKTAILADKDSCMECGACSQNCQTGAISVNAGVGCATAIIQGAIRGTEPDCSCCCGGPSNQSGY